MFENALFQYNYCRFYTLITWVSNTTFLPMSSVLPDPNRPLWPGLSTRISDAITISWPCISRNLADCSSCQIWQLPLLQVWNVQRIEESKNFWWFHYCCENANSRWNAGILNRDGPVDHSKECSASVVHKMQILHKEPIWFSIVTIHFAPHWTHLPKISRIASSKTIKFTCSWGGFPCIRIARFSASTSSSLQYFSFDCLTWASWLVWQLL